MTTETKDRWGWVEADIASHDYDLGVERLTDGRLSYRVMHPDGSNLAAHLNALEACADALRNEAWADCHMCFTGEGVHTDGCAIEAALARLDALRP